MTVIFYKSNFTKSNGYWAIFLLCFCVQCAASPNTFYPFDTMKQEAQFNHLLKELRCLVCQNQDLSDSNAALAKDLRAEVYRLVKDGKSDADISHYLTTRYGDFILFKPPLKWVTVILWFGPVFFLMFGLWIFWQTCLRRARHD